MSKHLYVYSSHGTLVVDGTTGEVVPAGSEYFDDDLRGIERFDIEEHQMFWGDFRGRHLDILDLGGWSGDRVFDDTDDGCWRPAETYGPPQLEWRLESAFRLVEYLLECRRITSSVLTVPEVVEDYCDFIGAAR